MSSVICPYSSRESQPNDVSIEPLSGRAEPGDGKIYYAELYGLVALADVVTVI